MPNRLPPSRQDRGPAVGMTPEPGLYRTRLSRNGPWVPARIWLGPPLDPETRQPLDRAHRLQCLVAGEECDPSQVWPMHPVSAAEYDRLLDAMPDDPRAMNVRNARTF